jgi:hypothetical protein
MLSARILVCASFLVAGCSAHMPEPGRPDAGRPDPEPDPDPEPGTTPAPDAAGGGGSGGARLDAAEMPAPRDAEAVTPADSGGGGSSEVGTSPPAGDNGESYSCTLIIGINATAEWYSRGFEQLVDNAKWELIRVHSGFVEIWADPKASVWGTGPTSACAKNGGNPDRIIFVALNFEYNTLAQWVPNLTAVVKNLQAKYPGVKRIELGTYVRAPGNKPCPQGPAYRSTITEAQDQANVMVAAANSALVTVSPKFEAKTCSEFSGNPPHPSASGGTAWAKMIAEHYGLGK